MQTHLICKGTQGNNLFQHGDQNTPLLAPIGCYGQFTTALLHPKASSCELLWKLAFEIHWSILCTSRSWCNSLGSCFVENFSLIIWIQCNFKYATHSFSLCCFSTLLCLVNSPWVMKHFTMCNCNRKLIFTIFSLISLNAPSIFLLLRTDCGFFTPAFKGIYLLSRLIPHSMQQKTRQEQKVYYKTWRKK